MNPMPLWIAAATTILSSAALAATPKRSGSKASPETVSVNAADVKWGAAPPAFPKGAQLAVLHGDPSAKGEFALRFRMPDGYRIAPHWHSKDEQLTVLSGTFILHLGGSLDAPAHDLRTGAYHFLPGKMHHAAEAKGETVLEVHGVGPFDIHFLDPADDPSKASASSK